MFVKHYQPIKAVLFRAPAVMLGFGAQITIGDCVTWSWYRFGIIGDDQGYVAQGRCHKMVVCDQMC